MVATINVFFVGLEFSTEQLFVKGIEGKPIFEGLKIKHGRHKADTA